MTIQTALACPLPTNRSNTNPWDQLRDFFASRFQPSTWVRLVHPPTAFSFDEAWLLCESDEGEWLAWIPDYGEILLRTDEISHLQ